MTAETTKKGFHDHHSATWQLSASAATSAWQLFSATTTAASFSIGCLLPTTAERRFCAPTVAGAVERCLHVLADACVAFLIDYLPYAVIVGIGYGIEVATRKPPVSPTPRNTTSASFARPETPPSA